MINLKDNSEKDKYILELFQTSPKEAFRLLFDAYHMKLCIYAVQLTDSFEMAEDIVQDFFIYFWEKKYYLKINQSPGLNQENRMDQLLILPVIQLMKKSIAWILA